MLKQIRLVEKRVAAAVDRLAELRTERDSLREEAASLRDELRALQGQASKHDAEETRAWRGCRG